MPLIPCLSIDGIDGAGKTSLVEALARSYKVVTLPKFHAFGAVPAEARERLDWFQATPERVGMRIYASAHRIRIMLAADFKLGLHQAFVADDGREPLLLLDRGPISVEAFMHAVLSLSPDSPPEGIPAFIAAAFREGWHERMYAAIDCSILLADVDLGYVDQVLRRRRYNLREEQLIRLQADYLQAVKPDGQRVVRLSPLASPAALLARCTGVLEDLKRGANVS